MTVIGVDGWKRKWVGVEIDDSQAIATRVFDTLDEIVSDRRYKVIAIDVPIGLPEVPPRQADNIVRQKIGERRSSVFASPPAFCLDERWDSQRMVSEESKRRFRIGVGSQTYALLHNIRAAHRVASQDDRVYEVHPEFTFFVMNNEKPLRYSKKAWNGVFERKAILRSHGLALPEYIDGEGGQVSVDDLIDAASCAWTANRIERNECIAVPDKNQRFERIWA